MTLQADQAYATAPQHRRAARLTLITGAAFLGIGAFIAPKLAPQDSIAPAALPVEVPADEMIVILDHVAFTALAPEARLRVALEYSAARTALAAALGATDPAPETNAAYFAQFAERSTKALRDARVESTAALAQLNRSTNASPLVQAQRAYEAARIAYIDHILTSR